MLLKGAPSVLSLVVKSHGMDFWLCTVYSLWQYCFTKQLRICTRHRHQRFYWSYVHPHSKIMLSWYTIYCKTQVLTFLRRVLPMKVTFATTKTSKPSVSYFDNSTLPLHYHSQNFTISVMEMCFTSYGTTLHHSKRIQVEAYHVPQTGYHLLSGQ